MKTAGLIVAAMLSASPAFAQGSTSHRPSDRIYFEGAGMYGASSTGLSSSSTWSGGASVQGGVHVGSYVVFFGEAGKFHDLQSDPLETAVDTTVSTLASNAGLDVTGSGRIESGYGLGGLRLQTPTRTRLTPYALAGLGAVRCTPSVTFDYTGGAIPNADPSAPAPTIGADVTPQIIGTGGFTQPAPVTEALLTVGGGAQIRISQRWFGDVGYRYYSTLTGDTPLHSSGVLFGFGGRF